MKYLIALLAIIALSADAAPFDQVAVSPGVTSCAYSVDGGADIIVPVVSGFCNRDLAGTAAGSHSSTVAALVNDAVWGSQRSAATSPLPYAPPAVPAVPTGHQLVPSSAPMSAPARANKQ